ncbi:MAG: insulinase family protein, partial [Geoalkalibacter sp.]
MVRKTVLDNGIRIISEQMVTAYSATIGFWVENGSRHEQGDCGGISHFIEHML